MFSFRSLFSREGRPVGQKAPSPQKVRPRFRPRLECLEDRTLLNARFVVPVGAPVDNVTNFATLASALDTAGLVSGDTITIRAGSAPGQVSSTDLQSASALVTNLTIQGDPTLDAANMPQFQVTGASTFAAPQLGFTLRNVDVALIGTGQLTFNSNATITNSIIVNDNVTNGGTGGSVVFGGTTDTLTKSRLIDDSGTNSNMLIVNAAAGNRDLISGNDFVAYGQTNAAIAYSGAAGISVSGQIIGNIITSDSTSGSSSNHLAQGIVVGGATGLTIQNNTISDNGPSVGATVGIDVGVGSQNTLIQGNVIDLTGAGAIGVRVASGTTGTTTTSVNLLFNQIATSLGATGGTGLQVLVQGGSSATNVLRVTAQGNDFHDDQIGVNVVTTAATTMASLSVDLGGGGTSQGGNDFRNTPSTGSATGGAIVVSGANPSPGVIVQAQNDIFGTGVTASSAVFNGGFSNASINVSGNLTGSAAFVQTAFQDFLHRSASSGDESALSGASQSQAAGGIIRSQEGLGALVDGLYQRLLGRTADAGGRSGFVNFLQNGGTVEQAIVMMVSSAEYRGMFGSDTSFVQSLYRVLLGREGSSGEVEMMVEAVGRAGRMGVANAFVNSTEFRQDVVNQLYSGQQSVPGVPFASVASLFPDLLHRTSAASSGEVGGQVNSGMDILSLEVEFASSPEFSNNG